MSYETERILLRKTAHLYVQEIQSEELRLIDRLIVLHELFDIRT